MSDATGTPETSQPARRRPLLAASPRFADSFGLVLLLLVVSYFVIAAAGDGNPGRIASMVIFATTTWLALRAAQVKRRILRIALALIPLATAIAIILVLVGNDETATIVSKILTILLVVVAPVAILRRLVEHPVISLNTFYGAVCVYLLIAMFFATTYGLIALLTGQQFFVQLTEAAKDTPAIDYLYFSFVTITTTGYGDFTAASGVGRMTAVLEAIFGQLYLITVVALVVQNLGQRSRMGRKMEEQLEQPEPSGDPTGRDARAGRPRLRRLTSASDALDLRTPASARAHPLGGTGIASRTSTSNDTSNDTYVLLDVPLDVPREIGQGRPRARPRIVSLIHGL